MVWRSGGDRGRVRRAEGLKGATSPHVGGDPRGAWCTIVVRESGSGVDSGVEESTTSAGGVVKRKLTVGATVSRTWSDLVSYRGSLVLCRRISMLAR